ncbi:DUF342 domain-containing protein [Desulfovibrio desulfuricans]|nr:DUF342 domain-containing protein [Desulfovibrio desulfuricans]
MQYYLRHYFNPDFDYLNLKPSGDNGKSDVYSLGYVQNVIAGQVLAELVPLDASGPKVDQRFILENEAFPMGGNTRVDPRHPNYLLAAAKGYVFYLNGKITVKTLLNVRQDVSFQTGNIFFVGDMAVHGSVRAGFSVQGNNVRIMGMVEGGVVRARRDLMIDGGVRGGAGKHSKVDAGDKLMTPFLESVDARARGNMVIEKTCLYSTVYAGSNMVVRDKLYGGTTNAYGSVYVGGQLGNKAALATKVYLGYDPLSIRQLEKIDKIIAQLSQTITHLNAIAGHLPPETNDASRKLQALRLQRRQLINRRDELWSRLAQDENYMQNCRLLCQGTVYPGVEISIGRAFMVVERIYQCTLFRLVDNEIIAEPMQPSHMSPK